MLVTHSLQHIRTVHVKIYEHILTFVFCLHFVQPTLNPNPRLSNDVVVVNCWAVRQFKGINRGDIVTLMYVNDFQTL